MQALADASFSRAEGTGSLAAVLRDAAANGTRLAPRERRRLYLKVAALALLVLWTPAVLVLALESPSYTSRWSLILPGAGMGAAVNLDSVGQASSTVASPYAQVGLDPRVNYQAIAESEPVRRAAAERVGIGLERFGKPRVKLLDQATVMHFSVRGESAREARDKSRALYKALQTRLQALRDDEIARREGAAARSLAVFGSKLADAQRELLRFQAGAEVTTLEQFEDLTVNLEALRREHARLVAARDGLDARVAALAATLGLEPTLAAKALVLNADPAFRRLRADHAAPVARLAALGATLGDNHPKVIAERARRDAARSALVARARDTAGIGREQVVRLLAIDEDDTRAQLFAGLIERAAEADGLRREAESLAERIAELDGRGERLASDAATLEDLHRKHQVATAVFTTALARQDIGKADAFAAYPLVQMLSAPTLPDAPDRLRRVLSLGGAAVGSLLTVLGLFLLWIRKPFVQRIWTSA